jgi:hypothetical protein
MIKPLKNVSAEDVQNFEEKLSRHESVYVAHLDPALTVSTPAVTLLTSLAPTGEDLPTFALLKVGASALASFKTVEDAALAACFRNKASWFREDLADETLRSSFKTFVDEDAKTIKVRVAEGVTAFGVERAPLELPGEGVKVKAVLELSRLTFGKTECGVVWKLRQLKLVGESKCLFEDDVAETQAPPLADSILAAAEVDDIDVMLEA